MKPGDLQLGLIDFFAVLVPGAAAVWLALQYAPNPIGCLFDPGLLVGQCSAVRPAETTRWALFTAAAYVLGHFVFMAGSQLDGSYDRWRTRSKPLDRDHCYEQAKTLANEMTPGLIGELSVLKWVQNYLQVASPASRLEVDRFEATQKLFRSLVVIFVATALHLLCVGEFLLSPLAGFLAVLSFHRFCDQRWKMTELAYSAAVITHRSKARVKGAGETETADA